MKVELLVASKECAMLPPSPPSSPLPSLPLNPCPPPSLSCLPGVYCHWCVFVRLCMRMSVFLCVCVHAQGMETPKAGPMTSDPLLLPNSPQQKPSRKSRQCCTQKKREKGKKESETKNRAEKEGESREGGQAQL